MDTFNDLKQRNRDSKNSAFSSASTRDALRLVIQKEREAQDLRRLLTQATNQLTAERERADAA
jgi:hypothetical protein